MNALKELEAKANKAAEDWSRSVVAQGKALEAYRKAHAEVLAHLDYLKEQERLRSDP